MADINGVGTSSVKVEKPEDLASPIKIKQSEVNNENNFRFSPTSFQEKTGFNQGDVYKLNLQTTQAKNVSAKAAIPMMDATSEKELAKLDPALADRVRLMASDLKSQGITVVVAPKGGFRSFAEQNDLYAQGRTAPGKIVTNAKGGESYHNYGLAADIVPVDKNGRPTWSAGKAITDKIGAAGEKQGLEWGGRWTGFVDTPHFQIAKGTNHAKDLLPTYNQGGLNAVWDKINKNYPPVNGATPITPPAGNGLSINNVPNYGQADPRWGSERYFTGSGTMANSGCTVTAAAIAASWATGTNVTPHDANANYGGTLKKFDYHSLMPGGDRAFDSTSPINKNSAAATDLLNKIKQSIKNGHPVVLGIQGNVQTPDGKNWSRHTVVASGINAKGEITVNDPATGKTQPLSAFKYDNYDIAQQISKKGGGGGTVSGAQPTTPTNPPNPSNPSLPVPTAQLQKGSTGEQVKQLQDALVKLKYMTRDQVNTGYGIFGPKTEAAVKSFQRGHGIEQIGIYGPKTQAALRQELSKTTTGAQPTQSMNPTLPVPTASLQRGSTGAQVKQLQDALVKLNYMTRKQVNTGFGTFGPKTEAAVKAFQRDHGIEQIGIYGPKTQAALRQEINKTTGGATNPPPANGVSAKEIANINDILKGTGLAGKGEVIANLSKKYNVPPELALAMFRKEASFVSPGSLAAQNNNPGNIRFIGQEGATQGAGGFARWNSLSEGVEAYFKLLNNGYRNFIDNNDWAGLVNRYAPPSENDSNLYVQQITAWMNDYRQRING